MNLKLFPGGDGGAACVRTMGDAVGFILVDGPPERRADLARRLEALAAHTQLRDWPVEVAARLEALCADPHGSLPPGVAVAATVGLASNSRLHLVWAGDVRVYAWTPDGPRQVTADHSLAEALAQAGLSPNDGPRGAKHILVRALGTLPSEPPEVAICELEPGAAILVCTQDLHGYTTEADAVRRLLARVALGGAAVAAGDGATAVPASALALIPGP